MYLHPMMLCALQALAPAQPSHTTGEPAQASDALGAQGHEQRATGALYSWADFNGDGLLDLACVGLDGRLQLFANAGAAPFEDVTERLGLADVRDVSRVLWADYDGDGRLDFFCAASSGTSRLFRNEGEFFVDMNAGSGLACDGEVLSAQWLDHDGDARLDLFVIVADESGPQAMLFRGEAGGFFASESLPLAGLQGLLGPNVPSSLTGWSASPPPAEAELPSDDSAAVRTLGRVPVLGASKGATQGGRTSNAARAGGFQGPSQGAGLQSFAAPVCTPTLMDQSNPGACMQADSVPTLGRLYPLSTNLYVAPGGRVGIGTTNPLARLHVNGTAWMNNTLTLNPVGDQALNLAAGNIYKGAQPFLHSTGQNTGLGLQTLENVSTGNANTAVGSRAMLDNLTGRANTAVGVDSLGRNTTGSFNATHGVGTLQNNLDGGFNTALGFAALGSSVNGANNIGIGNLGGFDLLLDNNMAIGNLGTATDSGVIRLGAAGVHTTSFMAGIRGVTTGLADGIPVLIDSDGQLGTVSSSRRFKKDIRDMGVASQALLQLRPVLFQYKQEQSLPTGQPVPPEYGLIAEEVAEVFPDLVVYDDEGQPFTVKYHMLSSMLLNEMQLMTERQAQRDQAVERAMGELNERLSRLELELAAQSH